jgi:YVTN family beta-propeller protein
MLFIRRLSVISLVALTIVFSIIGCGEDSEDNKDVTSAKSAYIVNGSAQTLSMFDIEKSEMKNDVFNTGKWTADIKIAGDKAYVVNTGDNNIQIVDLITLTQTGLINIGDNTSPERIVFADNNKAYVTCLYTNSTKVIDLGSNAVTKDIPVGMGPMGATVAGKKIYVCNPAYDFATNSYGKGTVSVIDSATDSVVKTIDVETNPLEAVTFGDKVFVMCVGNYVDTFGKLCIIDSASNTVTKTADLGTTPSGIAVSPKGIAYITTFGGLISVDVNSGAMIHTSASPLTDFASGSGIAFSKDGTGYICVADWAGTGNDKLLVMDSSEKLAGSYKAGGGASIVAIKD